MNEPIISPWLVYWAGRIEFIQIICCVVGLVVTAFAVTAAMAGKAKQDFSMENGIHYKDIRVQRVPWADKYGDVDSIPVEEWLNHGWYFTCDTCGAEIDDIKDFHVNSRGYCCKKCFNE